MTNHAGTSRDNVRIFLYAIERGRDETILFYASRGLISRGRIPPPIPPHHLLFSCRAMDARVLRLCSRDGSRWSDSAYEDTVY